MAQWARPLVAGEGSPRLALEVGVGLAADVDPHLGHCAAAERERGRVLAADRVAAVAADAESLAAEGEEARLGLHGPLGHELLVHVEAQRAGELARGRLV